MAFFRIADSERGEGGGEERSGSAVGGEFPIRLRHVIGERKGKRGGGGRYIVCWRPLRGLLCTLPFSPREDYFPKREGGKGGGGGGKRGEKCGNAGQRPSQLFCVLLAMRIFRVFTEREEKKKGERKKGGGRGRQRSIEVATKGLTGWLL